MGRSNGIWHSRRKLAAALISVLLFILAIDYRRTSITRTEEEQRKKDQSSDFLDDIDYALDTMRYMHDMQKGKAEIRHVVEKEHPVVEYYWWCRISRFQSESISEWTENDGLYLYSAYLDKRANSLYPRNSAIQVLAMSFRSLRQRIYCNIFDDSSYAVVEGYTREIWQRGWDPRDHFYIPNLITCPVPTRLQRSRKLFVSISTKPCRAQSVSLRVRVAAPIDKKKAVAVCVKGMDFQEDISLRLVEWLEAQHLLGASAVTIYKYTVSKNVQKVLDHYERLGKLVQIPLTLPGHSPNVPLVRSEYIARNRQQKRRHELIPYNDCLYRCYQFIKNLDCDTFRHITTHRYILILDIDELVVPLKHTTYTELIDAIEEDTPSKRISSLSFSNVFKFPNKSPEPSSPSHLYVLRNALRSRKISDPRSYGKSLTNTETVATVFNHFALHRLSANVSGTIYVPETLAVKLHYKSNCPVESRKDCAQLQTDTVIDHSLDRFAEELTRRVRRTVDELQLL